MALVFVSHAAVDSTIAKSFQSNIQTDFLGLMETFVSSNLDSLSAGFEWNQIIKEKLSECAILIGLLSPHALQRPWVYVEFGAGWIRGIPCIPVCHSGLDRGELPVPLSNFQALNLSDASHIEHIYKLISDSVGCQKPNIDFNAKSELYREITDTIRIQRVIVSWTKQLLIWNPELFASMEETGSDENVLIPADLDQAFSEYVAEASSHRFVEIERRGLGIGTRIGPQASIFSFKPGPQFASLKALLAST